MTYKQGCKYAALLGIPCLIFDVIARMPPFYHVQGVHRVARIILFPGWQVVHWLTGGVISRTFEYKLLMPLAIMGSTCWRGARWCGRWGMSSNPADVQF